jgi:AmmeMemoRadiSam system protein B/AmmeMemoRadiSam system protein A
MKNHHYFIYRLCIIWFIAFFIYIQADCETRVRKSILSGSWYEADASKLSKQIHRFFDSVPKELSNGNRIRALIAPHAGYTWSGETAAYSYKPLTSHEYQRVIILAPTHRHHFRGASIADVDAYETPLGTVPLAREQCDTLLKSEQFQSIQEAHSQEHSLEIQLPFLQIALKKFQIIPIVMGDISPKDCIEIANLIRPLLTEDTLLVISSDFTHQGPRFGYQPFQENVQNNIQRLDFAAVNLILNQNVTGFWSFVDQTRITICGRNPIKAGLLALPLQTQTEFVRYETSGDKTKDYYETVSYCSILFREQNEYLNEDDFQTLLSIARNSLKETFKAKKATEFTPEKDLLTSSLEKNRGAFVTLHKHGKLRGCIGHMQEDTPLYKTVSNTVLLSAFGDRRFPPLTEDEMKDIDIEISVLSPMKTIQSWKEIVLGRDGIIVEKQGKSAVYLPQVALEQGWTIEDTLSHLCQKAGLSEDDWKSDCRFKTFTAQVFGETFKKLTNEKS